MPLTSGQLEHLRDRQERDAGAIKLEAWLQWELVIQLAGIRELLTNVREDIDRLADCAEFELGLEETPANGDGHAE